METKLFIIVHTHRFGVDVYPVMSTVAMTKERAIKYLENEFEPNREDEFVDVEGPFVAENLPIINQ